MLQKSFQYVELVLKKHFLLLLMLKTAVLPTFFDTFYKDLLMNGKHLFEIDIFCNFINVFTDTSGQFNTLLLNKIYLFFLSFSKKNK